ncbi:MAG: ATP-binding cassette domain-containing protein [Spirochaetales bacterium]|nr:ATP-binding cassette domain-containing protein [Spirochaetales bacterium]
MEYVKLKHLTAGDYRRKVLFDLSWVWKPGDVWAVTGSNGSGKSALAALLTQELLVYSGDFFVDSRLSQESLIGFESQKRLLEAERRADLSDVSEKPDIGTTVLAFVGSSELLVDMGLRGKELRGIKQLSTGELRRACLARAWNQAFWILDEPYEGLDDQARELLAKRIARRIETRSPVLFLSRRAEDFPLQVSHVWELSEGKTVFQGRREDWHPTSGGLPGELKSRLVSPPKLRHFDQVPVLEFENVWAGYPDLEVLRNFSWKVYSGTHWLIRGPNGSGKSTLLGLISGEHPQAFQPGLRIFGKKRGPELTWADLHKKISHLSYAVHQRFRDLWFTPLEEVVAAAFQDAVRFVRTPSWDQVAATREILHSVGLASQAHKNWEELSWGEQRLALLARALVKDPELLLLDEPCQGLDEGAEAKFQETLLHEARIRGTTVIYVTHRPQERPFGDFQILEFPLTGSPSEQPT